MIFKNRGFPKIGAPILGFPLRGSLLFGVFKGYPFILGNSYMNPVC